MALDFEVTKNRLSPQKRATQPLCRFTAVINTQLSETYISHLLHITVAFKGLTAPYCTVVVVSDSSLPAGRTHLKAIYEHIHPLESLFTNILKLLNR